MARKSRYVAYAKVARKNVKGTKKQEPVKAPAGVKGERK
jgi:hypothetical protein